MSAIYRSPAGERAIRDRYRRDLADWPVPVEHRRVPTRQGQTFTVVCGPRDAPPIVLLHGSGANTTLWREDAAALARRHRVHCVDLIGEPGLSAPSRPPLDSDALSAWLDEVLDGLGIDGTALVGASLGGWVALDYAVRRPERVRALALLCPGGIGRPATGRILGALLLRLFGAWGARRSVRAMTGLRDPGHREVLDSVQETFAGFRPRTERLPVFSDADLRGLAMPTLVIVGDRDAMFDSRETARRVRAHVPRGTVTVLPGTGHAILGQGETLSVFLDEAAG
ncbi:alpha/beta hydrolase [Nocardiopsis sp. CNR-923]|uniref:alpha/beta fold hydrolase n=1 Tax=Nocardiopsis sp. CNR-923 TaxID=1904965 RepID=UPI00095E50A1|nr:alpha/beta fold hydrolase [Nocardiopsis sp. CNR-923]OLT28138.1 alpha/beta hydrolase [Nocardiopsis sp. CNR-923]